MSAVEKFCEKLKEHNLRYDYQRSEDGKDCVEIRISSDNFSGLAVYCFFDKENDESAGLRCFNVCKFPKEKNLVMLQTVNVLNAKYRWLKFYITEEGAVVAEMDCQYTGETAGDILVDALGHVWKIIDLSYPVLMKALYA